MLTVRKILDAKKGQIVWTISSKVTVYEALVLMAQKDIGALLVVDNDVVGIFSERDYARKVILKGRSSKETTVGELMSAPVVAIQPDATVYECMSLMTTRKHRHMPVVENGKLIGVISIGDVVNSIMSEQETTIRDLENFICGFDAPKA